MNDRGKSKNLNKLLNRLLIKIRRRDLLGFFTYPVDTNLVIGYLDVIKNPMDFSTMNTNIQNNVYKSLNDFKNDFLLVTNNAKTFNPPNNEYHLEAIRIEKYGLQLISFEESSLDDGSPSISTPLVRSHSTTPFIASLPVAWGVYADDDTPSSIKNSTILKYRLSPFSPEDFIANVQTYSEPNPVIPLHAPNMFSKKSRIQKKRLTRREQEILEKEPYVTNTDGSINADELDDPYSIIPKTWAFDTPYLEPLSRSHVKSLRPLHMPIRTKNKHFHFPSNDMFDSNNDDYDGSRTASVLDYGNFQSILYKNEIKDQIIINNYSLEEKNLEESIINNLINERQIQVKEIVNKQCKNKEINKDYEDFYRNYKYKGLLKSFEWVDDVIFGGVKGKAYLKSVTNFYNDIVTFNKDNHDRSKLNKLKDYIDTKKVYKLSNLIRNVNNGYPDHHKRVFEERARNEDKLIRKEYIKSDNFKVNLRSLILNDNNEDLIQSSNFSFEEINKRPENDPAGVLNYLKDLADKVSCQTINAESQNEESEEDKNARISMLQVALKLPLSHLDINNTILSQQLPSSSDL